MLVTRKSLISGKVHSLDLPITQEQLTLYEQGYGHIQDIFPALDPGLREFIMTGITPEEWDATFKQKTYYVRDCEETKALGFAGLEILEIIEIWEEDDVEKASVWLLLPDATEPKAFTIRSANIEEREE